MRQFIIAGASRLETFQARRNFGKGVVDVRSVDLGQFMMLNFGYKEAASIQNGVESCIRASKEGSFNKFSNTVVDEVDFGDVSEVMVSFQLDLIALRRRFDIFYRFELFSRQRPILTSRVKESSFIHCIFRESVDNFMSQIRAIDLSEGSKSFFVLIIFEEKVGIRNLSQFQKFSVLLTK
jgi:hypothetical protein